jgi:flagellar biosynthetic protein FliR
MNEMLHRLGIEVDMDFLVRLFSLIFARFLGAGLAIPFMGGQMIPGRIKFGIPLVFAIFLYPFIEPGVVHSTVPPFSLLLAGYVAKELFIGFCLGFVVSVPFYALEAAGSFMDTQRGTTFAQTIAPFLGGQASLLGNLYILLFMTIFLGMHGNHLVIRGIGDSYAALPVVGWPAAIRPDSPFVSDVIRISAEVFSVGLKIAAPVVIAMFVTDATLGVVNRVAPNVQVFWLGMPFKTLAGLIVVFVSIGFLSKIFGGLMVEIVGSIRRAVQVLAPGG